MAERPVKTPRPLTPKQERFILEYAKDFNATQAAIRAGYSGRCINRTASQLLGKTRHILDARTAQVLAKRESTGIASLEQTLKLCTAMAFYDPGKMYDDHGNCKEISQLSKINRLAVAGFKVTEEFTGTGEERQCTGYLKEFKLTDRAVWAHMLMKHLGAYPQPKALTLLSETPGPRFDTSKWTEEDWEAFKRLRQKSKIQVIDGA